MFKKEILQETNNEEHNMKKKLQDIFFLVLFPFIVPVSKRLERQFNKVD